LLIISGNHSKPFNPDSLETPGNQHPKLKLMPVNVPVSMIWSIKEPLDHYQVEVDSLDSKETWQSQQWALNINATTNNKA